MVKPIGSTLGFLGAIFDTMQNWQDNLLTRAPGHADRICTIRLGQGEGGMNLDMTPETITGMIPAGFAAGANLGWVAAGRPRPGRRSATEQHPHRGRDEPVAAQPVRPVPAVRRGGQRLPEAAHIAQRDPDVHRAHDRDTCEDRDHDPQPSQPRSGRLEVLGERSGLQRGLLGCFVGRLGSRHRGWTMYFSGPLDARAPLSSQACRATESRRSSSSRQASRRATTRSTVPGGAGDRRIQKDWRQSRHSCRSSRPLGAHLLRQREPTAFVELVLRLLAPTAGRRCGQPHAAPRAERRTRRTTEGDDRAAVRATNRPSEGSTQANDHTTRIPTATMK